MLPLSEQLLFACNMIARKLLGRKAVRPYIPDFKLAFEHVRMGLVQGCKRARGMWLGSHGDLK